MKVVKVVLSVEKNLLLKQKYFNLTGIQTHNASSCNGWQIVKVLSSEESTHSNESTSIFNDIQTHGALACTG